MLHGRPWKRTHGGQFFSLKIGRSIPKGNEKVFQPYIFKGQLLVSGRVVNRANSPVQQTTARIMYFQAVVVHQWSDSWMETVLMPILLASSSISSFTSIRFSLYQRQRNVNATVFLRIEGNMFLKIHETSRESLNSNSSANQNIFFLICIAKVLQSFCWMSVSFSIPCGTTSNPRSSILPEPSVPLVEFPEFPLCPLVPSSLLAPTIVESTT